MHCLFSLAFVLESFTRLAASTALEAPFSRYGVETLQWEIAVAPGQTEILNGTVQEVHRQVLQINPEYRFRTLPEKDLSTREAQTKTPGDRIICFHENTHKPRAFQAGFGYLRGIEGKPTNGPGPGNCGRVSCSGNSAIWWCNDNETPKTLDSWAMIADAAERQVYHCGVVGTIGDPTFGMGQNFQPGGWNTITAKDHC
ncbi:hypothetical protein PG996_003072 [Apiospora saccharicola]|uniref:Uncharacterized protein n=1 Tax=Apiospora saccharicola TaxID=335842 RepID=A0ABR1W0A6_9PEZI